MSGLVGSDWCTIVGLGMAWLGWQIVAVGGLPRLLKAADDARAPRGTPEAFQRFWIEQYRFVGLGLGVAGIALAIAGAVR